MEQKSNTITVDEIISLTEAAELLGLNSFRQVKTMIKNGHLKAYNKKWSKVKHVLKTDVIALREVEEA